MNIPFVTVVICNYNYGKYLKGALQSVLKQNYPHNRMQVIVIDDGSTDDSWEQLKEFTGTSMQGTSWNVTYKDDLRIIGKKLKFNHGPSYARNIAIEHTIKDSDCFAILDADDEFYPTKLAECVSILYSNELIGSVYADYDVLNVDTGITVREYKEPFSRSRLVKECIVHSGSVIKKEALLASKEKSFYDEELRTCEDYDLWLRIAERYMIIHIPKPLTLVRVTKNNSTNSVNKSLWEANWLRIYNKRVKNGTVQ